MTDPYPDDCFICRKHRGDVAMPGGPVYEDDLLYAGHAAPPPGDAEAYLGSLLVEPKRHVKGLAELTDKEAQRMGLALARLSRALTATEGAEHVYLFVLGHAVAHLHLWVVPRYPAPILRQGERTWVEIEEFDTAEGIVPWKADYFETIVGEYLAAGRGRSGKVGAARSHLFDAADLHRYAVEWMERRLVL